MTGTARYTFYARLAEVEESLGAGFVRIHQRYLVNAAAVERVDSASVTLGGETLPVSRSCQAAALLAIARGQDTILPVSADEVLQKDDMLVVLCGACGAGP